MSKNDQKKNANVKDKNDIKIQYLLRGLWILRLPAEHERKNIICFHATKRWEFNDNSERFWKRD